MKKFVRGNYAFEIVFANNGDLNGKYKVMVRSLDCDRFSHVKTTQTIYAAVDFAIEYADMFSRNGDINREIYNS